jgi:hypothetical protein
MLRDVSCDMSQFDGAGLRELPRGGRAFGEARP